MQRITAIAQADYNAALALPGPVFLDRGLIDAAVALEHLTGEMVLPDLAPATVTPASLPRPWPELFASDTERQHDFASAAAEYDRLAAAYTALNYDVIALPESQHRRTRRLHP